MIIIKCKVCEKDIEVENNRFKMCSECSHQKKKDRCKKYKKQNKEHVSEYNKDYKTEHKEQVKVYNHNYNIKNRDQIQKRQTEQHRERKDIDINFKLGNEFRSKLREFIKMKRKTFVLAGCDCDFFRNWIEFNFTCDMHWENHGIVWHLDHVIPVSVFDLSDENSRKICFNWKNTRPLLVHQNLAQKYSYFDILIHELKTYFYNKNNRNKFHNLNYGVNFLPIQSRNSLKDLVNR